MGHRSWPKVPAATIWRRHAHYDGKADHRTKPRHRCGKMVFEMVKDIKVVFGKGPGSRSVPSGYSSNIKRLLNLKEKKFAHVKSHDCHVLMTQLLLVALRGILPSNV